MEKLITLTIVFCLFSLNSLAETYYVTAKSLNIRSGAGSNNPLVGKLTQGQQVDVKSQKNGWSQVDGGWVASSFLSKNQTKTTTEKIIEKDVILLCDCVSYKKYEGYDVSGKPKIESCNGITYTLNFTKLYLEIKNGISFDDNGDGNSARYYLSEDEFILKKVIESHKVSNASNINDIEKFSRVRINRMSGQLRMHDISYINRANGKTLISDHFIIYQCKKAPERKF